MNRAGNEIVKAIQQRMQKDPELLFRIGIVDSTIEVVDETKKLAQDIIAIIEATEKHLDRVDYPTMLTILADSIKKRCQREIGKTE